MASPLKPHLIAIRIGCVERGAHMWVFDGEQWLNDDASASTANQEKYPRPHEEEFQPELQIIEIPRPRDPQPPPAFPFVIP